MKGMDGLEAGVMWLGSNALLTLGPAVVIAWVCWKRWGTARVRWLLASLLLVKLVMPDLPGWQWSVPLPKPVEWSVAVPTVEGEEGKPFAVNEVEATGPAWWALLWGLGVTVFAGAWLVSWGRVNGVIRRKRVPTSAWLARVLEEEQHFMGVREGPELCVLRGWGQAAVHGCWRTRLLLPVSWVKTLTEEELRAVLRHELAHVRRKDVLWSTLGYAVAALHWFHPLGWLALRRLRAEAELLCDEAALTRHDEVGRKQYGRVLIRMMETFSSPPPNAVAAFARHRNDIQHRILMIAQPKTSQRWSRVAAWLILPILSLALLTAGEKENPKTENRKPKSEGRDEGRAAGSLNGGDGASRTTAGQRDGDKPKEGLRDGDRPKEGQRDGDRPKEGQRDGEMKREGAREGDRPKEGQGDRDKPREGAREGEKMREGESPRREAPRERMREGEGGERSAVAPSQAQPMVIQLNAAGEVVNSEGRVIPDAEVKERLSQLARSRPGQEIVLRCEKETPYGSVVRVSKLLEGIDVKPTLAP